MEKWIISELNSFFVSLKKSFIDKIKMRCKLHKVKKELKISIKKNILNVYGKEAFYHDFDSFLEREKFISRILKDLYKTQMGEYKAVDYYVKFLTEEFMQEFPQYRIYKSTFEKIIYLIFKNVFDSLNKCEDENVRIINNNTKELIGELESHIEIVTEQIKNIQSNQDKVLKEIRELKNGLTYNFSMDNEQIKTCIEVYKQSLETIFFNKKEYIERVLDGESHARAIDALLEYKKIVLLGEPGCGKTTEALVVLEEVCKNTEFNDIIPIYMSLAEYGIIYDSIFEGICRKFELYIPNIDLKVVNQLISLNKVLFILDGADEIVLLENRNKFYMDINNLMVMSNVYILLTSRRNQYYGNVKNAKEISLRNINRDTIYKELSKAGIYGSVIDEFYDLFQYPLFLEIGVSVLKQNSRKIYNKSQLIEEYINLLFYKRDKEKGISQNNKGSFNDVMAIISEIAFRYFQYPSLSFRDFNEIFSRTEFSHANISDLFRIDIFSINTDIRFLHKQFKEYFAALYLVKNISIKNEIERYKELMRQDAWQEVLIMVCGIIDNIQDQKIFLDELMCINLSTYIRCVRFKNNLSTNLKTYTHEEYSKYYLQTLFDSYITIVNIYFGSLKEHFRPKTGKNLETLKGKKPCIVGKLSQDKKQLSYWFDWTEAGRSEVQLLDKDGSEAIEDYKQRASLERRNITICYHNLELGECEGDSARFVAIEQIKRDINIILKNRNLIEDDAILCERLSAVKTKVKFIKSSELIEEMYLKVQEYVDEILQKFKNREGESAGIEYNRINMLELLDILKKLYSNNVVYNDLIMPQRDKSPNGGWIWDFYSKEQTIKVVERFFYQAVISYQNMVEYNFPLMKKYFYLSKDYPFKYKVQVNFKEESGFDSEPGISYYYVSTVENDLRPEVKVAGEFNFEQSEEIFREIAYSYIKNGKEAKNMEVSDTGFTMCINRGEGQFNKCPLAAYIYKQIEKEFEKLFQV